MNQTPEAERDAEFEKWFGTSANNTPEFLALQYWVTEAWNAAWAARAIPQAAADQVAVDGQSCMLVADKILKLYFEPISGFELKQKIADAVRDAIRDNPCAAPDRAPSIDSATSVPDYRDLYEKCKREKAAAYARLAEYEDVKLVHPVTAPDSVTEGIIDSEAVFKASAESVNRTWNAAYQAGQADSATERDAAQEDAATVAENFGCNRPIVHPNPSQIVRGRWEGEQAASQNIASIIRGMKKSRAIAAMKGEA